MTNYEQWVDECRQARQEVLQHHETCRAIAERLRHELAELQRWDVELAKSQAQWGSLINTLNAASAQEGEPDDGEAWKNS